MDIQQVVREVTVRGQVQGMDQVARAYDQVADASDNTAASMAKSGSSAAIAEAAIAKLGAQLNDNVRQQERISDSLRQQSQALQQVGVAANDNSASARANALEWAEVANHLRQAAEAAYLFSPAFRNVVNAMAVPILKGTAVALEATAVGMVTATNYAGTGIIKLGLAIGASSSSLAPFARQLVGVGAALEAFSPSLYGVASSIVSRLMPALRMLGTVGLVVNAVQTAAEAWRLGGEKLKEWTDIAERAAKVDLSTGFIQRLDKAATDAKLPIDDLTAALKKLVETATDKLGGSDLQNRLKDLVKAGNFSGNAGVGDLGRATNTEQQFKAIVSLIDQAMQKGERLAALDLANTAFGPAITARLREDDEFLNRLLVSAEKIESTQLVSDEDISRALDLQNRYDAAVKILEQRWHPIQDLLTAAGVKMHEVWVSIVEVIAKAVDMVTGFALKVVDMLSQAFGWVGKIIDRLPEWAKTGAKAGASLAAGALATPVAGAAAGAATGLYGGNDGNAKAADEYSAALNRLAVGLRNANSVQQAIAQTNAVQRAVWKDTSKAITDNAQAVADAYDRALSASQKHIAMLAAEKDAVGLGAGALEEYRTRTALTIAAQQAGRKPTEDLTREIEDQAKAAGQAADALERTKVASQIDFGRQTALLGPEDLQIAQQLRGIYGNDVPAALASSEAAAIRVTNAIKEGRDAGVDFAKTFFQGLLQGKSAMDALADSAQQLSSKLADSAITDILSGNFIKGGIEGVAAIGTALFAGDQKAKKELQEAQAQWARMAGEVTKFNQAAAGVDLGPLTNELQSLFGSYQGLEEAARKAKDEAARGSLAQTLSSGIGRVLGEFYRSADELSPLQKSIKGVNDEAAGLKDTLTEIGNAQHWDLTGEFGAIDAAVKAQIKKLMEDAADTLTASLAARLNTAQGKSYLNDATTLLNQHATDLSTAALLGNDPAILAQISATFGAEAQKIIQDAGLVGDQFQDFIKLFPDLADVVHEATVDITDSIKTISQYLESLQVGSNSILSPQEQLAAAQAQFSQQLALAQGGNADALGSITKYADHLLGQAKNFYASSEGFAAIQQAVTAALSGLVGSSGSSYSATQPSSATASSSVQGITPVISTGTAAANDNGAYFAQQTSTLVQAIAAAASTDVAAIQDLRDMLSAKLDNLKNAVEGRRPAAPRPNARGAA
ncbi:hypothetical protein [Bradyrhizobium sp. 192]|uniref:hypothetical protein n=1 Tax=Bradyrhizobium sp. 192 TaxID=2782660 RepID=UPI001FFFE871|nr:hypothetical protein [Bradyrhizobium sp. 192]UPJ55401.1 hypothetical protein IVB24_22345 [Bradyrhizobium sp. 192]